MTSPYALPFLQKRQLAGQSPDTYAFVRVVFVCACVCSMSVQAFVRVVWSVCVCVCVCVCFFLGNLTISVRFTLQLLQKLNLFVSEVPSHGIKP